MTTQTAQITVEATGPDWKDHGPFYAQRGEGRFAFGNTEAEALQNLLAAEAPKGFVGELFSVTGRDEPAVGTGPVQPLETLTLTVKQLRDGRNELKTVSLAEVGHIIHGLRCAIQKGHDKDGSLSELVQRLTGGLAR